MEALYTLLTDPNLREKTGKEFEITRWDVEKQLVKELVNVCKEDNPQTHEEKVKAVFKAMYNVLVKDEYGYNLDAYEGINPSLDKDVDGKEYGRKYAKGILSIARFDRLYYCPPVDPIVGYRTRKTWKHLNYLYGELYFDEDAYVLGIHGVTNEW